MLFTELFAGTVNVRINGTGCHLVHGRNLIRAQLAKKVSPENPPLLRCQTMKQRMDRLIYFFAQQVFRWVLIPYCGISRRAGKMVQNAVEVLPIDS